MYFFYQDSKSSFNVGSATMPLRGSFLTKCKLPYLQRLVILGFFLFMVGITPTAFATNSPLQSLMQKNQTNTGAESNQQRQVILGIEDSPPYAESVQNTGLEVEVIRAALKAVGYQLSVEYMPIGRGIRLLLDERIDIVSPVYKQNNERFYIAQPHMFHRPTVFSLSTNPFSIRTIEDISRGSVAAYNGVLKGFGAKFQHIARQCPLFVELSDSRRIVDMLYKDRVDLAILDLHTFQYFLKANQLDASILVIHDLIEPIAGSAAFHDQLMKKKFEKGVRIILENGEYERIARNYLDKMSASQLVNLLKKRLAAL